MEQRFAAYAVTPEHPLWEQLITRPAPLKERDNEVRDPFSRDYTRILHSRAFRRLKHKTQVFPNVENDHVCTRMEHVLHVESVSGTIAEALGLSRRLTRAISLGHDLGHAPFGHQGEYVLSTLTEKYFGVPFWHEKNGVHFVDDVELLENDSKVRHNLNLTYAVRDGILSHCGEVEQNGIRPREELFDLSKFTLPGQYESATWEGCVVKMADTIAYLGRDIEDATSLGVLNAEDLQELEELRRAHGYAPNTTGIINTMVGDICANSSPERGITLSAAGMDMLCELKNYNRSHIYYAKRFKPFHNYTRLVIPEVFEALHDTYNGKPIREVTDDLARRCPLLIGGFRDFVAPYIEGDNPRYANRKLYGDLSDETDFLHAVTDYVAGMTDPYLIKCYEELTNY